MKDLAAKLRALELYDESLIERLPEIINRMDDEIKDAILDWLDNKIEKEITIHDVSFSLLKECEMDTINAYLALDWVKREPEEAISALKSEFYPVFEYFLNK